MKSVFSRVSEFIVGIFICGLFCSCGSGDSSSTSQPVAEKTDSNLNISGFIVPINFRSSAIGSHNYCTHIFIDDYSTGTPVHVIDANVKINDQTVPYDSTNGSYYLPLINGTFTVGSTFTVTINHPRAALTKTLSVPTTTVPSGFTFNPLFDNAANRTVQNVTYTISPTAAWSNFGCVIAYLYGTGTTSSQASNFTASIPTEAQITSSMLSFGTPAVLSQNISFAAWNMDKIDLPGFYTVSRLRVWAPNGTTIAQNF